MCKIYVLQKDFKSFWSWLYPKYGKKGPRIIYVHTYICVCFNHTNRKVPVETFNILLRKYKEKKITWCRMVCRIETSFFRAASCFVGNLDLSITLIATAFVDFLWTPKFNKKKETKMLCKKKKFSSRNQTLITITYDWKLNNNISNQCWVNRCEINIYY